MKHTLSILSLLFLSLCIFGCPGSNPSDNTQNEPSVSGLVVDANSVPIPDADIHYFFGTSYRQPTTDMTTEPTPSTRIGFSIPERSRVVINILQLGTRKHLCTLVDSVYSGGNYSITANVRMLTNGFYIYQIITDHFNTERIIALVTYDLSELIQTEPLTRSNLAGKFSVPMSILGIGRYMYTTSDAAPVIIDSAKVDSIAVVVYKDGKFLIEGFRVNETQSMTRTFVLK